MSISHSNSQIHLNEIKMLERLDLTPTLERGS